MRVLSSVLTIIAVLLLGTTSASAFEVSQSVTRTPTTGLSPGDEVIIDVFFDATDVGIRLFAAAMLFDPVFFEYDDVASNMLPIIYPAPAPAYGSNGGQPGYILYAPGTTGMPAVPPTALYPQQTPPQFPSWQLWVSPPEGLEQINFNFAEGNITDSFDTMVTGSNIWIASVVLRVVETAPDGDTNVELCNNCDGGILRIGDVVLPDDAWTVTGPITFSVPEPSSLALGFGALAVVGVLAVRRRRNG